MLTTTFRLLRCHGACENRYRHLRRALPGRGDNEPITLLEVLEANGLEDALWAFAAVPPEQEAERDRLARLLACEFAEYVLCYWEAAYPDNPRPREAIRIARLYAEGKATDEQLKAAEEAAWGAVRNANKAAEKATHAARDILAIDTVMALAHYRAAITTVQCQKSAENAARAVCAASAINTAIALVHYYAVKAAVQAAMATIGACDASEYAAETVRAWQEVRLREILTERRD